MNTSSGEINVLNSIILRKLNIKHLLTVTKTILTILTDLHLQMFCMSQLNCYDDGCYHQVLVVRPRPGCLAVQAGHGLLGAVDLRLQTFCVFMMMITGMIIVLIVRP